MTAESSSLLPEAAGVSRGLASGRAKQVSGLRYALELKLRPHAERMPGHEVLRFTWAKGAMTDLLLDYRDGAIRSLRLNGSTLATAALNGHLLLPGALLRAGENEVEIDFESRVAEAGAAITRYEDKDDGSEYFYSLFVPMDASMAFPCFDQPDLKARFTLSVHAPSAWKVISNTDALKTDEAGEERVSRFQETRPISTYLFAFAAGPWVTVHATPGLPNVYVRRSQVGRAEPEVPQLQSMTALGMAWLTEYFHQPFPFPKYDLVLVPGFPFGGMEHAGATFLREDAVLFRTAPTESDRFGRNIITLHELTHQWFGDMVTMRWFDDLWLKEGFAQYMAYRALEALEPDSQPWKHFYEDIKPSAYEIDETEGTTPIFQDIPNLKDAKSAYGAIVYEKAPAILKQLEFRLGSESFRRGLRIYLKQHAYGNAQWSDLIEAFHAASGKDVRGWADAWVLRRGMPQVAVTWDCAGGRVRHMTLSQQDVLPDGFTWPMTNDVLLGYATKDREKDRLSGKTLRVDWSAGSTNVSAAVGEPCPSFVFANAGDEAYGRFLLDEQSERDVRRQIVSATDTNARTSGGERSNASIADPLTRSMLWGALWDNVHVAKSPPRSYLALVLQNLPHEEDETLARIQGAHAATALHSYMTERGRPEFVPQLEQIAEERMLHARKEGLRIVNFRTLSAVAQSPAALGTLKQMLEGRVVIPQVELRSLDRWNLVGRLISQGDAEAGSYFAAEQKRDQTGDGLKYAWAVQAGAPAAAAKQEYFAAYLAKPGDTASKPED